ncbi:MAG: hypothetical protein H8E44_25935 [Planctomycetes bacterium]|nr:hypothetical protein [Planctomycetota bacterium]
MGFSRTKKMFWTRPHPLTIDFIHFHRCGSSYGAPISANVDIRVHFGIRVLNDSFPAAALNGPSSDPGRLRAGRYHLSFNARSGSQYDRCVDDLVRFVQEQGEPWFQTFQIVESLLASNETPLPPESREFLRAATRGESCEEWVAASYKLLGVKGKAQQIQDGY